jgi:glycosyltransferase involved in cell wall biosynthesis
MYKVKIGVPFNQNYDPNAGGGFSYTSQLLKAIDNHEFSEQIEIVFIDLTGKTKLIFKQSLLSFHPFKDANYKDLFRKAKIQTLRKIPLRYFKNLLNKIELNHAKARDKYISKTLRENQISFLFYANPDGNNFDYPFITTHWDVGHSSTYSFPEFTESFDSRKHYYENVIVKALAILTETETGKKELIRYTNLNEDRISVMPIFPGDVINQMVEEDTQKMILQQFGLVENCFFLYPAQFWAHKNHVLLIDALKIVLCQFPRIKLVLTGSNKGNLDYIKSYINNLGLQENIKILGFVSNQELYTLYKNAIALTMPTFLGPSNMPPLEAANLGCPVILSDLEGHKELMANYATYFNPLKKEELAEKMLDQINSNDKGKIFENRNTYHIDSSMLALENAFTKAIKIRKNWA